MSLLKLIPVHDSTADGIFKTLDDFFQEHKILWARCAMFTSDGAAVMLGKLNGVQVKVKVSN